MRRVVRAADVAWLERTLLDRAVGGVLAQHAAAAKEQAGTPPESPLELVRRCAAGDAEMADLLDVAAIDPRSLDGEGRSYLIEALERFRAMVDGVQQTALAAVVEATEDSGHQGDFARWEVAAALRLSQVTADRRTRVAADLVRRLPATLAALRAGAIAYVQAAHLAEAVADLDDQVAAQVEARVLPKMPDQTVAETRRSVQAAIVRLDPAGADARRKKAVRRRRIERMPQPEAMEGWWLTLPAHLASAMWTVLSGRATAEQKRLRSRALDDPGIDALRVDALIDAVLGTRVESNGGPGASPDHAGNADDGAETAARVLAILNGANPLDATAGDSGATFAGRDDGGRHLPRCSCGGRQVAAVVLDLPTALGLADNPGHLAGYGAIPGPLARRMAADRDWIRWTRDPGTRAVIDRGAHTYRPSEKLKAFISARDRVCGFPGCSTPAQACDCDHVVIFHRGGRTVRQNLGPLCRQHHNAKTHGGWTLVFDEDANLKVWTSPLGRTYTKSIDPILE